MCPALAVLGPDGLPLRPAILYLDQRSIPQAEAMLADVSAERVFSITGNPFAPGTYSATSIRWLAENEPDVIARAAVIGHGNTALAARMTGAFGFDRTNASFTGLFETGGRCAWSEELCTAWRIPIEKLAPTCPSATVLGVLTLRASRELGLSEGTPVVIGGADSACSALGAGVAEPGQAFETSGTSDVLAICLDTPRFDRRFMNRCHVAPDRWLAMGAMLSPGAAVSWLRDEILRDQARGEAWLDDLAGASPPGARGVIFLPYMQGERSPIWDPNARGVFFGLTLATAATDLTRAVLEGTAFGLRQNLEIAEGLLGRPVDRIVVTGGGARSQVWNQIKADVLLREIVTLDTSETAVLGAAMLAGIGAGVFADARDAVRRVAARPARTYTPSDAHAVTYDRAFLTYTALYPALKDSFRSLRSLGLPSPG